MPPRIGHPDNERYVLASGGPGGEKNVVSHHASDPSLLSRLVPEGSGVLLYVREPSTPWGLRSVLGDGPGVLALPTGAIREVWPEMVHPEDRHRVDETLSSLEPGRSTTFDYRIRTAPGGERWVRDSARWVPSTGGGFELVGVLRDVSLERTLRAQVSALEERVWRAQRMDSLGELAAGIAHDLRNLLTAILTTIEVIEEEPGLSRPVREDLAVVRESARRGSAFVRQILRFASREQYAPAAVDLNRVVEDLKVILGRALGAGVRLEVETDPELPELQADVGQIEQVLLNLAVNAGEAMPSGGVLGIRTRRISLARPLAVVEGSLPAGAYVRLTVSDTGQGIPEATRGRIFEPCFSTKARATSGSGFGLSTVQRIVRGHGGGITVESEEGKGTTFTVYLPVRAAAPALPVVQEPRESSPRGRVLLVEDDPAVRDVTVRLLAREGFSVMAVGAAREALQLFGRVRPPFQVVVSDVALPDRSGPELVKLLRNRTPRLPAVFVSGYSSEGLAVMDEPRSFFVEKPFTAPEIVRAIEEALASAAEPVAPRGAEGTKGG